VNSVFTSQLVIRALSPYEITGRGGDVALWEVMQPFTYDSALLGVTITVPQGMITDFASIPRGLWDHLSPDDPIILFPSVVHDFLYGQGGKISDTLTITREQADAVLREAMEVCGAGSFIRDAVYQFVQKFAESHWG
jgi:hypothetical protein